MTLRRRTTTALLTAGAALLLSLPALAQDDDESTDESARERRDPTYQSIRLTAVDSDFDNLDTAVNLGFTLGIRIPGVNFLAAEIDISSTLIPGDNSGAASPFGGGGNGDDGGLIGGIIGGGDGDGGGNGGSSGQQTTDSDDLRTNSVGIFAVGRTPGRFFGSARIGYRFVESTISELQEEQTGEAFGAGFGYRYGDYGGLVELTYTQYGDDLRYLGLAISY